MQLDFTQRLDIIEMLPSTGTLMHLRAARDLHEKLALSQSDMTSVDMKQEGERVFWDVSKEPAFEVEFTDLEREVLANALTALDASAKLRPTHLPLYDEFVVEEAIVAK